MNKTSRGRRPPKYALHKASGQARVRIDGHDHYLGAFGSPESREAYARLLAESSAIPPSNKGLAPKQSGMTVVELCAAYIAWAQTYYVKNGRPTTQVDVIRMALRALRALYGSTAIHSFGPLSLEALQESLIAEGRTRSYINKLIGEVRRLFKWASRKELVAVSVYQALATVPGLRRGRSLAIETQPVGPVDDSVIEATLAFLPPVVADMVRFHRLVGCRPTELCTLRPCDVDITGHSWIYIPAEHKTEHHGRQRRIFIGPKAQRILLPYLERHSECYCFSPQDSEKRRRSKVAAGKKSIIQTSKTTQRKTCSRRARGNYSKDSYNRAIRRAVDKLNSQKMDQWVKTHGREPNDQERMEITNPYWSPNQLRHAAATEIRKRFGIEAAQTVLGHSRADVTQVYAERDWNKAFEVMAEIG